MLRESERKWAPGEILVEFKQGIGRRGARRFAQRTHTRVREHIDAFDITVVGLPDQMTVRSALARFRDASIVEHAEPNLLLRTSQVPPDDPRYPDLWGLNNTGQVHRVSDPPPNTAVGASDADIDAPEAWATNSGDPETVVAVVDSGVDIDHPDLDQNIWTNDDEIPNNDIDDDGNGYVDDFRGWDFAEEDRTLLEADPSVAGYEHGTHVAGTIAAEMNNSTGIVGVCPLCRVMVLKFMRPGIGAPSVMTGRLSDELQALDYARKEGADIVNVSFSTSFWSRVERQAYARLGNAGVLTVAAAGNSSLDNDMLLSFDFPGGGVGFSPEYPASFTLPEIVSVAASNHKDQYGYFTGCDVELARWKCSFTNWGHDSVDLAAPGVDIVSTVPGGYDNFNGTSMSAPHVSGVAGLVASANPTLGPIAIKNALMNSVDKPDSLLKLFAFREGAESGRFTRTSGRLNASDALSASTSDATPETDGNISGARLIRHFRRGSVRWPQDVNDVYKKRLRKGKFYKVVLNGPAGRDIDLVAWKPGTKEVWQMEDGCFPGGTGSCKLLRYGDTPRVADESFRFKARRKGVYYFQVSAWLQDGGPYGLRVRRQ